MNRIKKKYFVIGGLGVILLMTLGLLYLRYASVTRIATLNFPDFTVEKLIRSNDNPFVRIESVPLDRVDEIASYDMVLVRVHGTSMDSLHLRAIESAIKAGVTVYSTESDNEKINSLHGRELQYVATLLENGSVKNYRSLFNYIRRHIHHKIISNGTYDEPLIVPQDYYFHLGDDNFFAEYADYQSHYEKSGKYKPGAPRVVLLSGNINLQNSNEEHMAAIINSLEAKGLNVYPINSFGIKKLEMIRAVKPNLIINRPHGRLVMGGGQSGVEMLSTLNVPILAPLTVSDLYEEWLAAKQGMASGGMSAMSVVMPELDGAIVPFAVAAQFEKNGIRIFDQIPEHTEKFCRMVKNFTDLQIKSNAEKKIAIYYYKGTGRGTINAADIEGIQSLHNTLRMLADNGYNVNGLPGSATELEAMIQQQGSVLGAYALGAYDEFIRNGNPELIETDTFQKWAAQQLPQQLIQDMHTQYGEFPGKYMRYEKDGKRFVAVARLQFGNVVILPQPMPSEGDDIEKLTHGIQGAPAYPYVASYLWTRNGFGADALIHFGTHGNLEFIPGKQLALSSYDWSDALVGDMPHFYIYTVNNIGEGIIAKRRSYATLVSHLTAPFMQGGLYDNFKKMIDHLHKVESLDKGAIRDEHLASLRALCQTQNIFSTLGIDSTGMLTDADIEKIHHHLEEINGAKVTDGLYTLGEPYSPQNIDNTTRLMSIDNLRYSLARIDVAHGKISAHELDNLSFMAHNYTPRVEIIISKALASKGGDTRQLLSSVVSPADMKLLEEQDQALKQKEERMGAMMRKTREPEAKKQIKFFDQNGSLIPADNTQAKAKPAEASMMEKMAQAKPQTHDKQSRDEKKNAELISALRTLKEAVEMISQIKQNLATSTSQEQKSLLNALSGGYIAPSSAGDPIVNPKAVPTGRNFYSINPETTPTAEAWTVGRRLADNLLEQEFATKGKYPEKVSFTLWSSDFISSEGASVAQILWLLGVEPLRDGFGYIRSLQLVPAEKLGRPRVDVVVQTSGQLRDIAASRLELINRAVAMAAQDESSNNYVRKGFQDAEKLLLEKGFSPAEARKFSGERIFGGANGNYGTGIMAMVEKGDAWESTNQIATQYIKNMGALYSADGSERWGEMREGVFQAALLNTSVVIQPRSSNTWGPLSLDHVYEFMGGISAAVQHVTGNDPTAYFNDFRNTGRAKVQELKEAIGVEASSTVFNPKYIAQKLKGQASSIASFAETVRNTYGWNAMKPSAIDQHIWNQFHQIYVKDSYDLGIQKTFSDKNPYAMQELTAVMLESARKGMWRASTQQIRDVAALHTKMVALHKAGCSGFICDNGKLQEFITQNIDPSNVDQYKASINAARQVQMTQEQSENSVVLKKEEQTNPATTPDSDASTTDQATHHTLLYVLGALAAALVGWIIYRKRRA